MAVTHQHKGALPHGGGHIRRAEIRPRHLHGVERTPCRGLHHIAGKALEQHRRHDDLLAVFGMGVGFGAEIKHCLAVGQRLQLAAQQTTRGFVHRHQQLAAIQHGGKRRLRQAGFALGKDIVPEFGAQTQRPFFTVLFRHGAVGRTDLYADGKLAVALQQAQTRAAVCTRLPQNGRHLGGGGSENTQDF